MIINRQENSSVCYPSARLEARWRLRLRTGHSVPTTNRTSRGRSDILLSKIRSDKCSWWWRQMFNSGSDKCCLYTLKSTEQDPIPCSCFLFRFGNKTIKYDFFMQVIYTRMCWFVNMWNTSRILCNLHVRRINKCCLWMLTNVSCRAR